MLSPHALLQIIAPHYCYQSSATLILASINHSFYHRITLYAFAFCSCQWTKLSRNPLKRVTGRTSLWGLRVGKSHGRWLARNVDITQAPSQLSTGFWFLMAFSSDPPSPTFPPLPPPPGQLFSSVSPRMPQEPGPEPG